MSMSRTLINCRGFLAVAGPWAWDYDTPRRVRVVWVSAVPVEGRDALLGAAVEGGAEEGDRQWWAIHAAGSYSREGVPLSTALRGEVETGEAIAPPRQRKDQARPWRYERGGWVCHRPDDSPS